MYYALSLSCIFSIFVAFALVQLCHGKYLKFDVMEESNTNFLVSWFKNFAGNPPVGLLWYIEKKRACRNIICCQYRHLDAWHLNYKGLYFSATSNANSVGSYLFPKIFASNLSRITCIWIKLNHCIAHIVVVSDKPHQECGYPHCLLKCYSMFPLAESGNFATIICCCHFNN